MLKKEGFFGKANLIWGFGAIVFFSLLSVVLLKMPCKSSVPIFSFCFSMITFAIINFFGLIFSKIVNLYSLSNYYSLGIILNFPVYYLLGILSKKLFNKFKNVKKT